MYACVHVYIHTCMHVCKCVKGKKEKEEEKNKTEDWGRKVFSYTPGENT